ncbi:modifier of partial [Nannochloropsis oceanica]
MFGFGRNRRAADRDLDALKRQQIDGLKQAVSTIRAVNSGQQDATVFDLPLPSASATAVLRVSLPSSFPDHPPSLRLLGLSVRHPWVDGQGVVSCHPKLNPWHASNSLAEVCVSVMQEITKTVGGSPIVGVPGDRWGGGVGGGGQGGGGGGGLGPMQPPPLRGGGGDGSGMIPGGSTHSVSSSPPRPSVVLPPLPNALPPSLLAASLDELNNLLSDEVAFSMFLSNTREVKECNRQLEAIRRTNADIAQETLEKRGAVTEAREEMRQALEILREIEKAYERKVGRVGEKGGREGGIEGVYRALEKEAAESEKRSEECAKALVSGEMDVAEWQEKYLKERKLFHARSAKLEKIQGMRGGGGKSGRRRGGGSVLISEG